jgi:putative acetyltransferase
MMRIQKTDSQNPDFAALVRLLDAELSTRDGDQHQFYAQFNTIDRIKHVVIAYENETPVSCGAIKEYEPGTAEIKRMYTVPENRGKGFASGVLTELESWARELSYERCILETGKKQPEAIALYRKNGYTVIPNYGQYAGVDNSVCFQKSLK